MSGQAQGFGQLMATFENVVELPDGGRLTMVAFAVTDPARFSAEVDGDDKEEGEE